MTLADRARAHPLWASYVDARAATRWLDAASASKKIATDLGLTETQRLKNLPKIAKQSKPKGRPRTRHVGTRCPYCAHELVIEVP